MIRWFHTRKLRTKILMWYTAFALLPMILITIYFHFYTRQLLVENLTRNLDGQISKIERELNDKIAAALRGAAVIDKPIFGSRELAEQMAALAQREELDITLVGLCTDICVVSNALLLKAYLPESPIRVIASACAGVTPESHQAALKTMEMCQIEILP